MIRRLLFAMVLLAAKPSAAQSLVRGPYVQQITPDSAVIVWRTDSASDGSVLLGAQPGSLTPSVSSTAAGTQHELRITNLVPHARYYYAVGTPTTVLAGDDDDHFFVTAPVPGAPARFRAWVLGDSGTGNADQAAVRDAMLAFTRADRPDIILHMGDMAYTDGLDEEFQFAFFTPYQQILRNTVVWPTIGNHEGHTADSATESGPYYDAYVVPRLGEAGGLPSGTEAWYAFDWANVHFVVLDSYESPRTPDGAMLQWLVSDLAATSQDWIIAFWHHPPYTKGSHDSDTETALVEMRENALPLLEAAGVDLVLAGHSHIYERSYLLHGAFATPTTADGHILDPGDGKPGSGGAYQKSAAPGRVDGAVYVVAGHGGRGLGQSGTHPVMYFTEKAHGSVILDVEDNRLTLANIRRDGTVTDSFAMLKGDGIVLGNPNGGETLSADDVVEITWTTVGNIETVDIEWSYDGGPWLRLATGVTASAGRYGWRVPPVSAARAWMRVVDASDPPTYDDSNGSFAIVSRSRETIIPFGSTWQYSDRGTDYGDTWLAASFDHSGWAAGPAQLGYGEGDEATALFDDSPNVPSVYFRRLVQLPSSVAAASVRTLYDDGLAVWINGAQVLARHVSDGTAFAQFASSQSSDNETFSADLDVQNANPFVAGTNVVAAMVKQVSGSSSDLSFDLELVVERNATGTNAPPIATAPADVRVTAGDPVTVTMTASDPDGGLLTFIATQSPAASSVDRETGTLTWNTAAGDLGIHAVAIDVYDSAGASTSVVFTVEVVGRVPDAGVPPEPDAGPPDAGVVADAGPPPADAGTIVDAGVPDATALPDASVPPVDAGTGFADARAASSSSSSVAASSSSEASASASSGAPLPTSSSPLSSSAQPASRSSSSGITQDIVDAGVVAAADAGGGDDTEPPAQCGCDSARAQPLPTVALALLAFLRWIRSRRG